MMDYILSALALLSIAAAVASAIAAACVVLRARALRTEWHDDNALRLAAEDRRADLFARLDDLQAAPTAAPEPVIGSGRLSSSPVRAIPARLPTARRTQAGTAPSGPLSRLPE
jgi:hypothetical protein